MDKDKIFVFLGVCATLIFFALTMYFRSGIVK